jgi:transposase
MANQSLLMSKVKHILRLLDGGDSKRSISNRVRVSRKTVDKYEQIFEQHPLSYKELLKLSDKELYSIIAPPAIHKPSHEELYNLFPSLEGELKKVGVSKLLLWEKYKDEFPCGVQYSQFCEHFRRYLKSQNLSYVFEHKAGDKLMVDFAGKKLHLTDIDTGELIEVEFFVGILPCSGLTYAQAVRSQQSADFLSCLVCCLEYIGGVPAAIVTDNLKAAVTKSSKYDPQLNPGMSDFAEHYNTSILPTRIYKPQDKALVESAINILYTRIYAPLRDKAFHRLCDLNAAILDLLNKHQHMLFQKKEISRIEQFNAIEKIHLKPLPKEAFILKKYQKAKVHPNCHIMLNEDKHHYSVPFTHVGKEVLISIASQTVEIYYKFDRIAVHQRCFQAHKYTTNESHLHPRHQYYSQWSVEFFTQQGQNIGSQTHQLITQIFRQCKHPEQGFKLCQGVLQLSKKYNHELMEQASEMCLQYDLISYRKLEYILSHYQSIESAPHLGDPPQIIHDNIRGQNYFQ